MRYAVAITITFFLAILSASAMPYVKMLGVTPDLVLIFAVCWAVIRGQDEALIVVPAAGFIRDLTTSDPVGTSVLAMIPIVLFATAVRFRTLDSEFPAAIVVTALASITYSIISMAVLAATGQHIDLFDALLRVVLPSAVVNALFCPIVYLPVRWLSPPPGPAILGRRRITSPL